MRLAVAAAFLVAVAGMGAAPAAATNECRGLQVCVRVAGPWVVVPAALTTSRPSVDFQLSCPRGYVIGGLDAELSDRAIDIDFLGKLVTGKASPRDIGGPILIAQVSGQVARVGFSTFLNFMAVLSINLAILNLLPIPILDGGQIAFLVAEVVRRKPLPLELRLRLTQIGFIVLLCIMIFATSNDIVRRWLGHALSR